MTDLWIGCSVSVQMIYDIISNSTEVVDFLSFFLVSVIKSFKFWIYIVYHLIYCDFLGFKLRLNDHIVKFPDLLLVLKDNLKLDPCLNIIRQY